MVARIHHWLSQGYLRGFALPGRPDHVWAYDFKGGKSFTSNTKNIGAEKDFNRFELDGYPPDIIETQLSQFEGEAVAAITATVQGTEHFSDEDTRTTNLNLMALFAVRNPRLRELNREFRERSAKAIMNVVLSSKQRFEAHVRKAKEARHIAPDANVSYEEVRDFEQSGAYRVEISREDQIAQEFEIHDSILQTLG